MIYLDNSATTQVDQDVAGTACEVMTEVYGNPSSVSAWKGCAGAADSSQAAGGPGHRSSYQADLLYIRRH